MSPASLRPSLERLLWLSSESQAPRPSLQRRLFEVREYGISVLLPSENKCSVNICISLLQDTHDPG